MSSDQQLFVPRAPRGVFAPPDQGVLYAVALRCAFVDMAVTIMVHDRDGESTVELEAVDPAWPRPTGHSDFEILEQMKASPAPLWTARATLSPETISALRASMSTVEPRKLADGVTEGALDGWTATCFVGDDSGRSHGFSAWSPSPRRHSAQLEFVQALFSLASKMLPDETSRAALEKWHGRIVVGQTMEPSA